MITLSSAQVLGNPRLYNNYMFTDPVHGLNIIFPLTADGGGPDPEWPINYTETLYGGLFYPWGYVFKTTYTSITADPFKGPHTITFSPTGLDQQFYAILKIIYDFGDGEITTIEKGIIPANFSIAFDGNPANLNISHKYWPKSYDTTTYTPKITVLNGNLATNVYNITLNFVPISFFEFEDIKLINTAQHLQAREETLGVFEIGKENTNITNARFFSAADTAYNTNLKSTNFDIIFTPSHGLSGARSNLILNLDASDPFTISKDEYNVVYYWKDKSQYNNDFAQQNTSHRPVFLYPSQSVSQRKSVYFNSTTENKVLTCINTTGFSTITGEYTALFVLKVLESSGTVFAVSSAFSTESLMNTEVSQILVYDRALTQDEREVIEDRLKNKWNI